MNPDIIQSFIDYCCNNQLDKAIEIFNSNTIDINEIKYDTNTSDIQGPYSLFECMCIGNHLEIVKWFLKIGIISEEINNGFISACQYNNIEIAEYIISKCDINILNFQVAFLVSCHVGNFEIVKWLCKTYNNKIDIHFDNETAFIYAIEEQHFDLAKWLYHISIGEKNIINVNINDNFPFIISCYNGRLDICKWLYLISNNKIDKHMMNNMPLKNAELSGNQELIYWLKN
jgi:ankyrin repeat protein